MDGMTLDMIVKMVQGFGLPGIVFIVWYFGEKNHEKTLRQYREDMLEQRRMYENNVELVKQVYSLAENHQSIVMLNTQGYQKLCDAINSNQFCPMVRLKKSAPGTVD